MNVRDDSKKNVKVPESLLLARLRRPPKRVVTRLKEMGVDRYPAPLSAAQRGVFVDSQTRLTEDEYNVRVAAEILGRFDSSVLRDAIGVVWRSHDALRTRIVHSGFQCLVDDEIGVDQIFFEKDFSCRAVAIRSLEEEARKKFLLSEGPLVKFLLFRVDDVESILGVVAHHLILDGWSMGLLMKEVADAYENLIHGDCSLFRSSSLQFADYCHWDAAIGEQRIPAGDGKSYWSSLLEGSRMIDLSMSGNSGHVPKLEDGNHRFRIPEDVSFYVDEVCQQEGFTHYAVFLAAFIVLLRKYSRSSDIRVGTPVSGRELPESESLIGMFVHMLVVREVIGTNDRFVDLVRRISTQFACSISHYRTLYSELAGGIQCERRCVSSGPFEVAFVLQNMPFPEISLGHARVEEVELSTGGSSFDLTLFIMQKAGGWEATIEYDPNRFSSSDVSSMSRHYCRILEIGAKRESTLVESMEILNDDELARLNIFSRSQQLVVSSPRVELAFDQIVREIPDSIALRVGSSVFSYSKVRELSLRLSNLLHSRGVEKDHVVALWFDKCEWVPIAMLAVLRLGATYFALDSMAPVKRNVELMRRSRSVFVLSSIEYRFKCASAPVPQIFCEDCLPVSKEERSVEFAESECQAACLFYTSGSTGEPKGVLVPHRGIVSLVSESENAIFSRDHVYLQLSPTSFDASIYEIWGALLNGGELAFPATGLRPVSPEELCKLIERYGVTTMWLTSSLFNFMVDSGLRSSLPGLKQLLIGGDVVSPSHVERFMSSFPDVKVVNGYGPTESTTFSAIHVIDPIDSDWHGAVPIGKPIAGRRIFILDDLLELSPPGVIGEICISGAGLAIEYLEDKELTDRRFVHFESGGHVERVYRTGDKGRWRNDGVLEFHGRIDASQVKVRGFRVETSEVEMAIRRCEGILDACVVVVNDEGGCERELLASVVSSSFDEREIRSELSASIPGYMIPRFFQKLDSLPLTTNGKVDRGALVHSFDSPQVPGFNRDSPDGMNSFRELISGILARSELDMESGFFEQGGHSLLALKTIEAIEQIYNKKISLQDLYASSSLYEIWRTIDEGKRLPGDLRSISVPSLPSGLLPAMRIPGGRKVLVTGSTGYFGKFIIETFLKETDLEIVCLVRADDDTNAMGRLSDVLESQGLVLERRFLSRLQVVSGDISLENWGLDETRYKELVESVGCLLLNGAHVNFVASYQSLRKPNVDGVVEAVKFSSRSGASLCFVSTISSLSPSLADSNGVYLESQVSSHPFGLLDGYSQSKWAAERVLGAAAKRGFDVSIFRVGRLIGGVDGADVNSGDFLSRMILGCIELGAAPDLELSLDMTPVRFASRALVEVGIEQRRKGVFHLVNPNPASSSIIFRVLSKMGFEIPLVSYDSWRKLVVLDAGSGESGVLGPLLPGLPENQPSSKPTYYDMRNLRSALSIETMSSCRSVDEELVHEYLSALLSSDVVSENVKAMRRGSFLDG